ncbi:hypothetical protein QA584_08225 [Anaerocolumna sp. AGMB13025]|uniref:hypothetical protein n=1 Tax=Anaerocolumna sp. AGMB13025 TaxID=3039116 RepID=UPI00241E9B79|nr:hypothetical protein [Anaerocolumna sp. AGMB13025]WFR59057.1 hypothetical protein QA584_08225 [Anaerocolumna sp. AGMB13025]
MCKFMKKLFVILLSILLLPTHSYALAGYTTDDLRVLMGRERLSEEGTILEIKALLSTCYKQQEWNELVQGLKDVDDKELKDFKEKEDAWYQAKDKLEANFTGNKPIKTILSDYVNYQTAASHRAAYSKSDASGLSFIDAGDIKAKIDYANSILEGADDKTKIGVIGYKMKTFTKANLLITVPFGRSYSIDSGKEQDSNGLTIAVPQDIKVYSQFNGTVAGVTDNTVTIRTGKSIEIEYLGIKPAVGKNQKVKQYGLIGTTKSKTMTIKFKLNTVYEDPLLLYGSMSTVWYELWKSSNPGCAIDINNYTVLLDKLPEKEIEKAPELYNAGTITNQDGLSKKIIIEGDNGYTNTPDHLILDKTEAGSTTD